jgi:glucose-6-phosphate 1-dehydrogenase
MEPPTGGDPSILKDSIASVFRAMPDADPKRYVRGQYDGYRDVDGVAKDSKTETFAALRLEVENWRWSGVPFFIRAGKELPVRVNELRVVFHHPPRLGFFPKGSRRPEPDQIVVRLDPGTGIRVKLDAQRAESAKPEAIELDMEFAEEGGEGPTPYEVLLQAAMLGQSTRFTRQDSVEQCWRILQPLLDRPGRVHPYERGTWGPKQADDVVAGHGTWHEPWLSE